MSDATIQERRLKYGISSLAAILIVAGILIALNVIGTLGFFVRADLTEGDEFTVSKPSKAILRGLDDVVVVRAFFSEKLPPQLATLRQQVQDLLKEYQVHSRGKLQVQFIDPGSEPEEVQKAQSMGIPQLQMNLLEKDQYQVSNVFMGIGVQYADKVQAIPVVQDMATLEYDLTSAILKVTSTEEKSLGVLTGNQERDLQKDFQGAQDELSRQYKIRPVNLNGGRTPVPDDIATLIVAGSKNVPERVRYEIDQFVMRGGHVIFLIDAVTMNEQMGLQAFPSNSGLEEMLGFYGAGVKSSLVLDVRNALASFAAGFMSYTLPYPYWPKVSQNGLDRSNPITSRLESVTFPWTAPLELRVPEAPGSGQAPGTAAPDSPQPSVRGTVLARTTDRAWTQSGRYDLNPQALLSQQPPATGETYPLAIALTGNFKSYFEGKPVPPKPDAGTPPPEGAPPQPAEAPALTESPETQILVVGSSQFVTNTFLRMFPENMLFLQNAVDWMTIGTDLIAIRSRGATERPVKQLSDGAKTAVKTALTWGLPVVIVALGFIRGAVRRRARERAVNAYYQPAAGSGN